MSESGLQAEVSGLVPAARIADDFAAPLELAPARFDERFRDGFVSSSAAGLRAAVFSRAVWVAGAAFHSRRTLRRILNAVIGRVFKVDEVGFVQQSTLALVRVVVAKLPVGAHFAALLVDVEQALGNG